MSHPNRLFCLSYFNNLCDSLTHLFGTHQILLKQGLREVLTTKGRLMHCPCGSGKTYNNCCKPYIEEGKKVPNVELLMRSRYTAFATKNAAYILDTSLNDTVNERSIKALEREFESVEWLELIILESARESIEFKAFFRTFDGPIEVLHEHSLFEKKEGKWYYRDGTLFHAKVERNQPCPCGSGEKYKKCCGK